VVPSNTVTSVITLLFTPGIIGISHKAGEDPPEIGPPKLQRFHCGGNSQRRSSELDNHTRPSTPSFCSHTVTFFRDNILCPTQSRKFS